MTSYKIPPEPNVNIRYAVVGTISPGFRGRRTKYRSL